MRLTDNKLFAVVITHNGSKTIIDCINSLKNSKEKVDIVVIDNASTDETPRLVQSIARIKFIQLENNIGFGQANNIGFEYALDQNADFVFLLNQDAMVECDTIGKLVEMANNNPEYGILSPIHLNGDGSEIDQKFSKYIFRGNRYLYSDLFFNRQKPVYELTFINAAAWLITAKCIRSVGYFAPLFFMYGEDNDYCFRVVQKKFKIGIIPNARIYHARCINLDPDTGWVNIKKTANRAAVEVIKNLANPNNNFIKVILFWIIDFSAKSIKNLLNRAWKDLIISHLTAWYVISKIPRIKRHRKQFFSH
jgi:GT2 family glycosyltransferase